MTTTIIFVFLMLITVLAAATWILIPNFLEQPKYERKISQGPFQIRLYEDFLVSEIVVIGPQKKALREGFIPLARYIGGKDRYGDKISMTVPVMQKKVHSDSENKWLISFSMPSKYEYDTLPESKNKNVYPKRVTGKLIASYTFNGHPTNIILKEKEATLIQWLGKQNFVPKDTAIYSFYNDPMTPGFFRKNEILIEVEKLTP